jgi:hypothetical protein
LLAFEHGLARIARNLQIQETVTDLQHVENGVMNVE